jgi:hypothetical protein
MAQDIVLGFVNLISDCSLCMLISFLIERWKKRKEKMKKGKGRKKLRMAKIKQEENARQTTATHSKNEGRQTQRKQEKGRI